MNKLNPLIKGLMGDLYGQILGRSISDGELDTLLGTLFKSPWAILPKIRSVVSEMNDLRRMLVEIEKAA